MKKYFILAFAALCAAFCGCRPFEPEPDNTVFHVLSPAPERAGVFPPPEEYVRDVNVMQTLLPSYFARSQIVSFPDGTTAEMSDIHRWVEPIKDAFTRCLARNIETASNGGLAAFAYPARSPNADAQTLFTEVSEARGTFGGDLRLRGRWFVRSAKGGEVARGVFDIFVPCGNSYAAYVDALNAVNFKIAAGIAENLVQTKDNK